MALSIPENTFLKLSEAIHSIGYEVESIKCVHKSSLADNSCGFFNGFVLCIYRKAFLLRLFSKSLHKNSYALLFKALSSFGFDINSIKTIRKPSGLKAIRLRINSN